jgi:glutamate/tyrosine decarboxylase-like PLP-dependent enzyme
MKDVVETLRRATARPLPHPDLETLQGYCRQVSDWILHDFATLPDRRVGIRATRGEMEKLLREPAPEQGRALDQVLAEFQEKIAPFTFRPNHPRFFAFIPGVPQFLSVLGEWLCAGTNYFAGVWLEAAGPSQVEIVVLDWFKEFLGYPKEARGILTSGGSEANLIALVVARERLPFSDRGRAVLYLTEHRHWSVDRAAKVIGLSPDQVRALPADDQFRLDPATVTRTVQEDAAAGLLPWVVVANAGATNTGTIDPLVGLADICQEHRLWLHVDAAYGWPAVLTEEGKTQLHGIDRADSITLDPHKWFGQTFESGCVLIRSGRQLPAAFALRPDYMQDVVPGADEVNFADEGLALTRRFRALKIWLSIKVLGLGWFRDLIHHSCNLIALAQELLVRSGRFEILCPRQLSVVCFRYRPSKNASEPEMERMNQAIFEEIMAGGRAFLSTTRLNGKLALRLCSVNWRTTAVDVEEVVRFLIAAGEKMSNA